VLLVHLDGLHGGDNLVDETAIAWIQAAVRDRGANASVLWIDEKAKPHAWRLPPRVKAALAACDVLINHSYRPRLRRDGGAQAVPVGRTRS